MAAAMSTDADKAGDLLRRLIELSNDDAKARDRLYVALRDDERLPLVTLHRYMCAARGCQIATVFKAGGTVLCAVRDHTYSPGMSQALTTPSARARHTIDRDQRRWPSVVYDVTDLADEAEASAQVGVLLACRHVRTSVLALDILAIVSGVTPGHPGPPTRL
jgi:hypothetical protein